MPLVDQKFNNALLKKGTTAAQAVLLDAGLDHWFQADYPYVTLSGTDIVSFNDRKNPSVKFVRSSELTGATLQENLFGNYPGARCNSSESDRSIFNGVTPTLTAPFVWAGVATLRTLAASCTLMGTFTSSTVRAILNVSSTGTNAGKLGFLYGTASAYGPVLSLNQPFAFAAGYDGTNIFLRVNGATVTAAAAGSPSTSALALAALPGGSQFWDGDISDIFMCNLSINTSAGTALLGKIQDLILNAYGLSL